MTEKFEPAMKHIITNLEAIKIVSDPLRLNLLHMVTPEARTVKQAADILGLEPHKLYYHMGLLEKHGLVKLVDTQIVGGVAEKYYRAVAHHFQLSSDLLGNVAEGESNGLLEFANFAFSRTQANFSESMAAGLVTGVDEISAPMMLSRRMALLTPQEALEFTDRIAEVIRHFTSRNQERREEDEERQPYVLLATLFPTLSMEDSANE